MKIINLKADCTAEALASAIRDSEKTNRNIRFDERRGRPAMLVTEKGKRLRITCKYVGGTTRDNGFIVGTYFTGRVTEKNGAASVRGVVWTAPVFHAVLFAMLAVFIIQCIYLKGFSVIPFCAVAFDIVLFRTEFAKQGIISRYIARAAKRAEAENKKSNGGKQL